MAPHFDIHQQTKLKWTAKATSSFTIIVVLLSILYICCWMKKRELKINIICGQADIAKLKRDKFKIILFGLLIDIFNVIRSIGNLFLDYPYHDTLFQCKFQATFKTFGGIPAFLFILWLIILCLAATHFRSLFDKLLTKTCLWTVIVTSIIFAAIITGYKWQSWCDNPINHRANRDRFFYVFIASYIFIFIAGMFHIVARICCSRRHSTDQGWMHKFVLYYLFILSIGWFPALIRRIELLGFGHETPFQLAMAHIILMSIYPVFNIFAFYYGTAEKSSSKENTKTSNETDECEKESLSESIQETSPCNGGYSDEGRCYSHKTSNEQMSTSNGDSSENMYKENTICGCFSYA
eukprot:197055_1